jgi:chromosome segregation ATPase
MDRFFLAVFFVATVALGIRFKNVSEELAQSKAALERVSSERDSLKQQLDAATAAAAAAPQAVPGPAAQDNPSAPPPAPPQAPVNPAPDRSALSRMLAKEKARLQELQGDLKRLEGASDKELLAEADSHIANDSASLKLLQQQLQALSASDRQAVQSQRNQQALLQKNINQLNANLASINRQISAQQKSKAADRNSKIQNLVNQQTAAQNQLLLLQSQAAANSSPAANSSGAEMELRSEINSFSADLNYWKNTRNNVSRDSAALQQALRDLRAQIQSQQERVKEIEASLRAP